MKTHRTIAPSLLLAASAALLTGCLGPKVDEPGLPVFKPAVKKTAMTLRVEPVKEIVSAPQVEQVAVARKLCDWMAKDLVSLFADANVDATVARDGAFPADGYRLDVTMKRCFLAPEAVALPPGTQDLGSPSTMGIAYRFLDPKGTVLASNEYNSHGPEDYRVPLRKIGLRIRIAVGEHLGGAAGK